MKPSVLITGAYGGMGRAAVKTLTERGFRVFALDRTVGDGEENVIPVKADITDENSIKNAFERIVKMTDELFAIVHFAGIYMLDSLVEMESEAFERIFKVNLGGVYLVNRTFIPLMKSGSRIVIITSELAPLDPLPFTGVYAVSKAALDKYAYSLCMELQLKGIKVSVLRAGAVDTDMLGASTDALDRFCQTTELYTCNAERFKRIVDSVEARSIAPLRIAEKTACILAKRNPRFAYSINRNPLLLMLNVLPKRLQLWVIKQVLKTKQEEKIMYSIHNDSFDKQKVYELLQTIPCGKVVTYGDLAQMLGNKTWARSVGNALHDNPDGDKYPCYKVVNSKGRLSHAYAFGGLEAQKRRLEKDGIVVENNKVDLVRYGYRR